MTISPDKIIAHRGAWKDFNLPQNSLAAFLKAQEFPIAGVEFDLQFTKDEKIVVFHDDFMGGKLINDLNYKDLCNYKLFNGEFIPLLAEFLKNATIKQSLWIELKESQLTENQKEKFVDNVLKEIEKYNLDIYFISFDFAIIKRLACKSIYPCLYLNDDCLLKKLAENKIKGIDISYEQLLDNSSLFFQVKRLNMILNTWTVNDKDIAENLIQQGVDFITTDELQSMLS